MSLEKDDFKTLIKICKTCGKNTVSNYYYKQEAGNLTNVDRYVLNKFKDHYGNNVVERVNDIMNDYHMLKGGVTPEELQAQRQKLKPQPVLVKQPIVTPSVLTIQKQQKPVLSPAQKQTVKKVGAQAKSTGTSVLRGAIGAQSGESTTSAVGRTAATGVVTGLTGLATGVGAQWQAYMESRERQQIAQMEQDRILKQRELELNVENWKKEHEAYQSMKQTLESQIDALLKTISDSTIKNEDLEKQLNSMKSDKIKLDTKLKELETKIQESGKKISELNEKITSSEKEIEEKTNTIRLNNEQIDTLRSELKKFDLSKEAIDDLCKNVTQNDAVKFCNAMLNRSTGTEIATETVAAPIQAGGQNPADFIQTFFRQALGEQIIDWQMDGGARRKKSKKNNKKQVNSLIDFTTTTEYEITDDSFDDLLSE